MKIEYTASVMVPAGWRSITVTALVNRVSKAMAEVIEVVAIDGEAPTGWTSRTGAKRQTFNARGIAQREIGMRKRLSACSIIED